MVVVVVEEEEEEEEEAQHSIALSRHILPFEIIAPPITATTRPTKIAAPKMYQRFSLQHLVHLVRPPLDKGENSVDSEERSEGVTLEDAI